MKPFDKRKVYKKNRPNKYIFYGTVYVGIPEIQTPTYETFT